MVISLLSAKPSNDCSERIELIEKVTKRINKIYLKRQHEHRNTWMVIHTLILATFRVVVTVG